jgi:hypothetical protein
VASPKVNIRPPLGAGEAVLLGIAEATPYAGVLPI